MDLATLVTFVHAAATLAMTGLIWFVQVVHYPLFAQVGVRRFATYETQHVRRTGYVVMPLMLTEIATAAWLAVSPPNPDTNWLVYSGLVLLALIWLSTAVLQVPCHRRLEAGLDVAIVRRLVASNWIRTVAWTARAVIAMLLIADV